MNSKEIIKYLKNSINEKGSYCYSLPVETTKAIIKCIEEKDNVLEKLRKITKQDECDYYVGGLEGLVKEKNREIERLNNIINELEKYIKESCWKDSWGVDTIYVNALLNKLQELKGDSSNGKTVEDNG